MYFTYFYIITAPENITDSYLYHHWDNSTGPFYQSITSAECKKRCKESDGEMIAKSHLNEKVQNQVLNLLNGRPNFNVTKSSIENNSNIFDMHFHIAAWFDHRTGIGYWDTGERIQEKYWLKKSDCDDQCTDQVSNI